jgi:hypothetical protein
MAFEDTAITQAARRRSWNFIVMIVDQTLMIWMIIVEFKYPLNENGLR